MLSVAVPVVAIVFIGTVPDSANAEDTSPLTTQVVNAEAVDLSSVVAGTSDATVVLNAAGTQQGHAFRLKVKSAWDPGNRLSAVPPGATQLDSTLLDSARWLAQEFFNIGDRLQLPDNDGTDFTAERDAYQLAIWSFTDNLDLDALPARK